MLTCAQFVKRLMAELTSTKMLNTVKPLVEHLCWHDDALTAKFVEEIRAVVKKEEHSATLKPSFRAVVLLCEVADSKQAARCDAVIGGVLDEMQANSQYFLATEACIALLMRMAKHHDTLRTWLKEVCCAAHGVLRRGWCRLTRMLCLFCSTPTAGAGCPPGSPPTWRRQLTLPRKRRARA